MVNEYEVEIRDKNGVHILKNIKLEDLEQVLKEYPKYESINAKKEDKDESK